MSELQEPTQEPTQPGTGEPEEAPWADSPDHLTQGDVPLPDDAPLPEEVPPSPS